MRVRETKRGIWGQAGWRGAEYCPGVLVLWPLLPSSLHSHHPSPILCSLLTFLSMTSTLQFSYVALSKLWKFSMPVFPFCKTAPTSSEDRDNCVI